MLTLAVLVMAAAPAAPPTERSVVPGMGTLPGRSCVAVDVRPSPRASRRSHRAWAARHVVDLEFHTSLKARRGSKPVQLRVLAPGGHLYQTLTASQPDPSRSLSRTPTPPVAMARLSVAGSQITQRGLYGLWIVVPYLEGELRPCGPPASFTLEP